jgi:two-component system, OmpR family, catabolic regulation response regulator CreB
LNPTQDKPTTVLIVDDEPALAAPLAYVLKQEGFAVLQATRVQEAEQLLAGHSVDFLVLDVGLPDQSGFEFCKRVRKTRDVPILFLTARTEEVDRIVGLEIGGDDYVAKPFSPREVCARVKNILRRARPTTNTAPELTQAPATGISAATTCPNARTMALTIDEERARVVALGKPLDLTKTEYLILKGMVHAPERVFSRNALLDLASSSPGASLDRAIDAHIKTIRQKLRSAGLSEDVITTHRGLGYSLQNPVSS